VNIANSWALIMLLTNITVYITRCMERRRALYIKLSQHIPRFPSCDEVRVLLLKGPSKGLWQGAEAWSYTKCLGSNRDKDDGQYSLVHISSVT